MKNFTKFSRAIYNSVNDVLHHDGVEHAGYIAFLGLLSFFPFLVLLVALAGAFGQSQVGTDFVNFIFSEIPERFVSALKPRIEDIVSGPPQSLKTLAIFAMIWTASSAVEGLRTILNRAYRVGTPPSYLFRRLLSILQFIIITILLMIALMLLVVFPAIWTNIEIVLKIENLISPYWTYFRYVLSVLILFISIATSYFVLPNIKQKWSNVWPGTLMVVILWIFTGVGLSIYINNFQQVNLVYGSLEGIIVVLLFFYLLALIYIFGAEFNYHFATYSGEEIVQLEKAPPEPERIIRKPNRKNKRRKNK